MSPVWDLVAQGVLLSVGGTPETLSAIDPDPPSKAEGLGLELVHIWEYSQGLF